MLTSQTRDALRRIIDDRRRPLAHIFRARIVLLSDERLPVLGSWPSYSTTIMTRTDRKQL